MLRIRKEHMSALAGQQTAGFTSRMVSHLREVFADQVAGLDDESLRLFVDRVCTQAEEWGIPIIFHTATAQASDVPLRYADPIPFDDVAFAFPRLKIIMAHWGHPWQREVTMVCRKHPNVYIELSANFYHPWALYNALITALEWRQTDKIFFGTDYPVATAQEQIDGLRKLNRFAQGGNPRIPDEVIEGIIYRDSLSILGIDG